MHRRRQPTRLDGQSIRFVTDMQPVMELYLIERAEAMKKTNSFRAATENYMTAVID